MGQEFESLQARHFSDISFLREELYQKLKGLKIKGTILLASEGINGTIAGEKSAVEGFFNQLQSSSENLKIIPKYSYINFNPFPRLKVKLKKEIVSLGKKDINPIQDCGEYVDPKDWNSFISQDDVMLIDTRNDYEYSIGNFPGSINPQTNTFRELPDFLNKLLDQDTSKETKVAMYCTGGIRCEKSTALFKQAGFKNVFHLKGGILGYLSNVSAKESLWQGECFVFDDRVSVNHSLEKGSYDMCHGCRNPITDEDKSSIHYVRGVSCPSCFDKKTSEQKKRYADRQKQVDLAKAKNGTHIGPKEEVYPK